MKMEGELCFIRAWGWWRSSFCSIPCLGTQETHHKSPFPMLAMEGIEAPPSNSPWGYSEHPYTAHLCGTKNSD